MTPNLPATHDLVLIGGGHTHALVLHMWGMRPLVGARLTLINPGPTAPYSGMLPGFVAGHYSRDALEIDLVRLARFADARLIDAAADHIDLAAGQIHVPGRAPVGFDLASVDVGITSAMPDIPGFSEYAVPAKPLGRFAERWAAFRATQGPAKVVVIGAGVAGAELAAAMAHALRSDARAAEVTLIEAGQAFSALKPATAAKLRAALEAQGITLMEAAAVTRVEEGAVCLSTGSRVQATFIVGAAGAKPHAWLAASGLDTDIGFLSVDPYLRCSDPRVFAAGDCANMAFDPRPKAGVFAVRQAPILFHNLRAVMSGGAMRRYAPQKDYLKLISLGGKRALADRYGVAPDGPLMWRWKDRIDRRFMQKFRTLPHMRQDLLPKERTDTLESVLGPKPMCGGCGAKVGRGALREALHRLPAPARPDVTALPGDDAALLTTGGQRQVLSTDHLRGFTLDPVAMARIAAHHALGDIWAMGAAPQAATATLILPRQAAHLQGRQMDEIMQAAAEVMRRAGAEIVGGHSSLGDELTIGFSITGLLDGDPITLAGAQPGDVLILTKPLGTGILMAAEMAGEASGRDVVAALSLMQQSQGEAAEILHDAHAMTDVTGFGLAGHLKGICEASGLGAVLRLGAVPRMAGVDTLVRTGVQSTLAPDNRAAVPELPQSDETAILFDPQTAGGLLAAVAEAKAPALVTELQEAGYQAVVIGVMEAGSQRIRLD